MSIRFVLIKCPAATGEASGAPIAFGPTTILSPVQTEGRNLPRAQQAIRTTRRYEPDPSAAQSQTKATGGFRFSILTNRGAHSREPSCPYGRGFPFNRAYP